jgi:hypothetical protein
VAENTPPVEGPSVAQAPEQAVCDNHAWPDGSDPDLPRPVGTDPLTSPGTVSSDSLWGG